MWNKKYLAARAIGIFQWEFLFSVFRLAGRSPLVDTPSERGNEKIASWAPLNTQPSFAADTMLLLTDGTVMVHELNTSHWHRLTPDSSGGYVNGSWSTLASLPDNNGIASRRAVPQMHRYISHLRCWVMGRSSWPAATTIQGKRMPTFSRRRFMIRFRMSGRRMRRHQAGPALATHQPACCPTGACNVASTPAPTRCSIRRRRSGRPEAPKPIAAAKDFHTNVQWERAHGGVQQCS